MEKINQRRIKQLSDRRPLWTPSGSYWPEARGSIRTHRELQHHLATAIQLELSTIPPYLCALYSIKSGTNAEAVRIIRSVVVEEMLHMILACNILNAIGGELAVNRKGFIPTYPGKLPHSDGRITV